PVGADYHSAFDLRAVGEDGGDARPVLTEARAARAELDRAVAERLPQDGDELGAVEGHARHLQSALRYLAGVFDAEEPIAPPTSHGDAAGRRAGGPNRIVEAE